MPARLCPFDPHLTAPIRLQAEGYARKQIARINEKPHFKKAQITWDLKKSCGNSWVEIQFNKRATKSAQDEAGQHNPAFPGPPPSPGGSKYEQKRR